MRLTLSRLLQPKKVKNVSTDILGKKYGRVHMQKQDFNKMALKKMKGLKRTRGDANPSTEDGGRDGKRTRVEAQGDDE